MSGRDLRNNLDAEPAQPRTADVVRRLKRQIELDIQCAAPAHVVSYDAATERATITIGHLPAPYQETPAGSVAAPSAPITVSNVPVAFPGSSTARITFPISSGDTGLVVFADRAMLPWVESPIPGPVDPINARTHDYGDAVFLPGLKQQLPARVPPVSPTATVIDGPTIQIGATAAQAIALAPLLHNYLVTMFTAAATTAMDGGASFKAAILAYLGANPFSSYATTKATAE